MISKHKKIFGVLLFVYIVLLHYIFPTCASHAAPRKNIQKYNVILIAINVLRADHLSSYGYHRKTTPTIDKLADKSFVFKNTFAQAGYTLPSMMSIITSLYPESHKVLDAFKDELSTKTYTIAEIFKIYGYKTAWFSVLHLPHLDINVGFGRGYDYKGELDKDFSGKERILSWLETNRDEPFLVALNTISMHSPYIPIPKYKGYFHKGEKGSTFDNRRDLLRACYYKIIESINTPGSRLYKIFDQPAIDLILDNHNKVESEAKSDPEFWEIKIKEIEKLIPLEFLYRIGEIRVLTYNSSINVNNKKNLDYLISLYDSCLFGIDQELIKPILTKLKNLNLYEKTIIIITGDHGELLGEHQILGHGLHAKFYDEVIQVPLIIKLPDYTARKDIPELTQSIDIMPTILDFLGMEIPAYIQGKSLLFLMNRENANSVHEHIFGQNRFHAYLRSSEWKLIVDRSDIKKEVSDQDKLFDIKADPEEMINLRDLKQEVYKNLRNKIRAHLETMPVYLDREYTFKSHIEPKLKKKIKETGYW
jgi:arylsulfatase A-like enzyme